MHSLQKLLRPTERPLHPPVTRRARDRGEHRNALPDLSLQIRQHGRAGGVETEDCESPSVEIQELERKRPVLQEVQIWRRLNMANRSTLAACKLDDFKRWLVQNGWTVEPCKGDFEVLRARKLGRNRPLLVYKRLDEPMHLTIYDIDVPIIRNFIRDTRRKK